MNTKVIQKDELWIYRQDLLTTDSRLRSTILSLNSKNI